MHENRETSTLTGRDERHSPAGEGRSRTARMNDAEESDRSIIPVNQSNNAEPSAAEIGEGRERTKENTSRSHTLSTQREAGVSRGLRGVREAAKERKRERFTALLHHLSVDLLRESFYALKRQAAPGVDGVTWREYETGLEDRITDLHRRVHRGAYRAQPSRRVYIPKTDGRQRPLGIASLEDKIVQQAVVTILNAIYKVDFKGFSYGFRPGRSPHQALDALNVGICRKRVSWILDADIRGFFDNMSHEWTEKFLQHRVADPRGTQDTSRRAVPCGPSQSTASLHSDLLILGEQESFLWTVTKERVTLYQLPARDRIEHDSKLFAKAVEKVVDAPEPGRTLRQDLFGGSRASAIWKKPNWLIAADGALLQGIPFSALPCAFLAKADAPLIATHTLRFIPSELLLLVKRQTEPDKVFLGVADPVYNSMDSRMPAKPRSREGGSTLNLLTRLPGGDREVKSAARFRGMPRVGLLLGPDACARQLHEALTQRPAVLHFAVHVVSPDSHPDEAAIALSLSADAEPELLTREAILNYRVPGALVVVDGCFSGQGAAVPTAGLIGFSRAWLLAGAAARCNRDRLAGFRSRQLL